MRIALAQINPIVGDLFGNAEKIIEFAQKSANQGAELVVFPELCVCGYPPMDFLDNPLFVEACAKVVQQIAERVPQNIGVLVGVPVKNHEETGKRLFNAALLLEGGKIVAEVHKLLLPTYDVFDEYRYFEPEVSAKVVEWRGKKLGIHICEDMWNNEEYAPYHMYDFNPIDILGRGGAEIFINLSASPYARKKQQIRTALMSESAKEYGIPFLLVNQVGANTELIFDGASQVVSGTGEVLVKLPNFEEALTVWDSENPAPLSDVPYGYEDDIKEMHDALVLGIRDYYQKSGFFKKALIGLSGGIDSAVTAALAINALGADKVVGVTMPSRYSSEGSWKDSEDLAEATGIEFHHIAIKPAVAALEEMLSGIFAGREPDVTEENIQARVRGTTLMAISNKMGHLLLTTGNKSEMAVGYCTLYGDMNGGLAILSDVFKMDVYALARYINEKAGKAIIPQNTIDKAPSAELRPGQVDQDSLPPYPVLDEILRLYVEQHLEIDAIVAKTGFPYDMVMSMLRKVDANEFKRKQAAPGLRVTGKAFGAGRRLPIVMKWDRKRADDMVLGL